MGKKKQIRFLFFSFIIGPYAFFNFDSAILVLLFTLRDSKVYLTGAVTGQLWVGSFCL